MKALLKIVPFFLLAGMAVSCAGSGVDAPRARGGVIDLSSLSFSSDATAALNGEWRFRWEETPAGCTETGFNDAGWETFNVPDYWNARERTADGYAWFRLHVTRVNASSEPLGLFLKGMQTAGRLFVNGREIMRDGTPGTSRETTRPGIFPQVAHLPPADEYVIAWLIANYHNRNGGPRYAPVIGSYRVLARDLFLSDIKDAFIIGFIMMMGLYNFILWLLRTREKASLVFAILCFVIAVRLLVMSAFAQRIFGDVDIYDLRIKIESLANLIGFCLFPNFLRYVFPEEMSRPLLRAANLVTAALAALIIFLPNWFSSRFIGYYNILIAAFIIWVAVALVIAVRRRRSGAVIMMVSISLLALSIINELVYIGYPAVATVNLVGPGMICLIICYSAILSYRFARLSAHLQKEVEAQTEQISGQKRELERLIKEKTDVFINFNHETKTPLTLMSNYLDKYVVAHGEDDDLAVIRRNLDKLMRDVTNSLDLEKLIRNQTFYRHDKPTAFTVLVRAKVHLFEPTAAGKGVHLSMAESPDLFVRIDPFALDRILNNLLDNAIRYTDRDGRITVSVGLVRNRVELAVADTGRGIPRAQREKIFEPYYQISQTKGNLQGMGMGLSIVKKIMASLGGDIRVESREGAGTRFLLSFTPCEKPAESDQAAVLPELSRPPDNEQVRLQPETFLPERETILLIEDNKRMLAYLQDSLGGEYNVYYACSGREAIAKLENIPQPQLIISDIMMDEMDGYELLDVLLASERHKSIPLVFLTARSLPEDKLDGLARGAVDVVHKPFSIDELRSKIRSLIQNRKSQRTALVREMQEKMGSLLSEAAPPAAVPRALAFEDRFRKYKITPREREIVQFLLQGLEYKEIAERMGISFNTVKPYIMSVYRKCGVQNKVELANLFSVN